MSTDKRDVTKPSSGTTEPEDTHPAQKEASVRPTPHGDGEPREKDGEESPSED
ncbi:hypothetical protein [Demequina activiva]|uniref:Uncharacterized protein n=1 Tax=Demequina activiva TaxID=1582364 RepID=A0A919UJJ3_9MICO|nr:hypothetical protein [Demequina activiva]GIG53845.1 hypothetical protein Dac01nite_05970 [Demequina activiva]